MSDFEEVNTFSPTLFPKGIRVHVHVYGNNEEDTISSALSTYEKILAKFKESGHVMAVMNGGA